MDAAIGDTPELGDVVSRPQAQLEPRRAQLQVEKRRDVYCRTVT
jgi:hypothetical protein